MKALTKGQFDAVTECIAAEKEYLYQNWMKYDAKTKYIEHVDVAIKRGGYGTNLTDQKATLGDRKESRRLSIMWFENYTAADKILTIFYEAFATKTNCPTYQRNK